MKPKHVAMHAARLGIDLSPWSSAFPPCDLKVLSSRGVVASGEWACVTWLHPGPRGGPEAVLSGLVALTWSFCAGCLLARGWPGGFQKGCCPVFPEVAL